MPQLTATLSMNLQNQASPNLFSSNEQDDSGNEVADPLWSKDYID